MDETRDETRERKKELLGTTGHRILPGQFQDTRIQTNRASRAYGSAYMEKGNNGNVSLKVIPKPQRREGREILEATGVGLLPGQFRDMAANLDFKVSSSEIGRLASSLPADDVRILARANVSGKERKSEDFEGTATALLPGQFRDCKGEYVTQSHEVGRGLVDNQGRFVKVEHTGISKEASNALRSVSPTSPFKSVVSGPLPSPSSKQIGKYSNSPTKEDYDRIKARKAEILEGSLKLFGGKSVYETTAKTVGLHSNDPVSRKKVIADARHTQKLLKRDIINPYEHDAGIIFPHQHLLSTSKTYDYVSPEKFRALLEREEELRRELSEIRKETEMMQSSSRGLQSGRSSDFLTGRTADSMRTPSTRRSTAREETMESTRSDAESLSRLFPTAAASGTLPGSGGPQRWEHRTPLTTKQREEHISMMMRQKFLDIELSGQRKQKFC